MGLDPIVEGASASYSGRPCCGLVKVLVSTTENCSFALVCQNTLVKSVESVKDKRYLGNSVIRRHLFCKWRFILGDYSRGRWKSCTAEIEGVADRRLKKNICKVILM